jgi:hypothetical protein
LINFEFEESCKSSFTLAVATGDVKMSAALAIDYGGTKGDNISSEGLSN